ncbi:MAG: hypothetical protein HY960_07170 [Ignavibacteriae bacterium]|nr:hypothetical protein [Ignavibacteriota bacterium]
MKFKQNLSLIFMVLFSVGLIQLPLFNYLGYEFSAAVAFVIPFLAGPMTINIFRQYNAGQEFSATDIFRNTLKESLNKTSVLLAIPFVVATLNIVLVKNCSYSEGIIFYLLIPVITAFWSISLALLCAVLFHRAILFYFCIVTFALLHPLYLGYFTPAIYSYNFIYGYFPGFSYDEVLTITPTLVLFRLVTVFSLLVFGFGSWLIVSSSTLGSTFKEKIQNAARAFRWDFKYIPFLLLLLVLFIAWIFRFAIGFESSVFSIQRTLTETYQTEHFIIHYAPGMFTRQEREFVGLEHEFRLYQDKEALNMKFNGIITSYIYPDAETKRKFIGTGTTNISKPWRKEIHLNKDSWQEVLKHELVHVLAGEFGLPIIKAHYNIGLTEGLATAIDDDWGNRTLHEYAAAIKKFEIASHPEKLISPEGFMSQASSLSYVLMGSFCKFVIDEYGIENFKQLYGGSSVQSVYKKEYAELIQEWQLTIDRVAVPDAWKNHVEYFFRRQSIFAKECARVIARINEEGFRSLINRQHVQAKEFFQLSLEQSWNTQAFMGLISTEYATSNHAKVIQLMKELIQDSSRKSPVAGVLSTYGNSLWQTGDTATARIVFTKILEYDLSDRTNESALLRIEALNDTSLANYLRPYFTSPASGELSMVFIDSALLKFSSPLLKYLKAKISFRLQKYDEVIQLLIHPLTADMPITYNLSPDLASPRLRLLGESYFRLKDYQQAKKYFADELLLVQNEAGRKRVEDWMKRCEWFSHHLESLLFR